MIAAQQYFIEYNNDMNSERLLNLLPNYIPDYCLSNAEKSVERWKQLVVQAYKKVNDRDECSIQQCLSAWLIAVN